MPPAAVLDAAPTGASIWLTALFILAGLVGIVIPVVPGLLLALFGVLLWALDTSTAFGWVVFGLCVLWYAAGVITQFLLPGRRLRTQGVGTGTLILALLVGIVGFFVIPVLGGPLGFVLAIYLVERLRSRDAAMAGARTKHALKAVVTSMGIELMAGLLIAATWAFGALVVWRSAT